MGRGARSLCILATAPSALVVSTSTPAYAQLHWDASAQVGGMKRVLVDRPESGGQAGFGPVGQLAGHIALLPLVRVGGYLGHDISPLSDASARDLTWGGLRAKVMSPWPRGSWRAWLFVGFGYAGAYARSTRGSGVLPGAVPVRADVLVDGAGGGFFQVPFGLGASYKLRKPFELSAELGMHAGFGHTGSMYADPGPALKRPSDGRDEGHALPAGQDRFAIGLTVGVLIDL